MAEAGHLGGLGSRIAQGDRSVIQQLLTGCLPWARHCSTWPSSE